MKKQKEESFLCPHCNQSIDDHLITAWSGKIGGRKTAKRGSGYFRELARKRKSFKGGRPLKQTTK